MLRQFDATENVGRFSVVPSLLTRFWIRATARGTHVRAADARRPRNRPVNIPDILSRCTSRRGGQTAPPTSTHRRRFHARPDGDSSAIIAESLTPDLRVPRVSSERVMRARLATCVRAYMTRITRYPTLCRVGQRGRIRARDSLVIRVVAAFSQRTARAISVIRAGEGCAY